ncbi:uncharacterized protein O3C94_003053 [Discoglossus pictus]
MWRNSTAQNGQRGQRYIRRRHSAFNGLGHASHSSRPLLLAPPCKLMNASVLSKNGEEFSLYCGQEGLQFTIPKSLKRGAKLKVLNEIGKMEVLHNNPSCNTWVTQTPDGSVVVGSTYDGCYVSQTNTDYVLTIGISTKQRNGKMSMLKKEIRCSVALLLDDPSPSQCAEISKADRLACTSAQETCQTLGCCYDPSDRVNPCFYGNAVTAYCSQDGLFSVSISANITQPPLVQSSVRLAGSSGTLCNPVNRNNLFTVFTFPISSCGTTSKITGNQLMYENALVAEKNVQSWNRASISRDSTFRLLVRCYYTITGLLPLKVDVVTLPPPPPVSSVGPLLLEMRLGLDGQYSTYYTDQDYPVVKMLRDPVFVEVRILQKTDPNVVLVLHQCWATPTADPMDQMQWPILASGCPFTGDNYLTQLVSVPPNSIGFIPSHYSRFIVKTFTFVDGITQTALGGQVFLHCSASACVPSSRYSCTVNCSTKKKRSNNFLVQDSGTELVTFGPVFFQNFLPDKGSLILDAPDRLPAVRMEGVTMAVVWLVGFIVYAQAGALDGDTVEEPGLVCEVDRMQYTIPKSQIGDMAPKLTALDKKGNMQIITEDSSCGVTLTDLSDGSIVLASAHEGCYVSQRNDVYMMVLDIYTKDDYGKWKIPEQKELRCPVNLAMDAPSPSQCTSIKTSDRLLCGKTPISQDVCQSQGCCYDASDRINPCYYGNTVTAQCTQDGMFSVAISKDVTRPSLILTSVKISRGTGPTCSPTAQSNSFILFSFPLSSCGTTFQTVGGDVVYENEFVSQRAVQTWQGSSITRDSTFKLTVRCSMSSSALLPVNVNVFTLSPPPAVASNGPLNLEMRIARDALYNQYYNDVDYPIVKTLRDPVFVEVHILQRVDPQLVLMLQQCWATPAPSPFQQVQWPLLLNGCPFNGDNYLTQPIQINPATARLDFPTYYQRFVVSTFTFVDSTSQQALSGQVYLHCSASVCVPSATQSCAVTCSRRGKRSANDLVIESDLNLISSPGPVNFLPTSKDEASLLRGSRHTIHTLKIEYVGIAAAIGVICLVVAAVGIWKCRKHKVSVINME